MGAITKLVPLISYSHAVEETKEVFAKKLSEELVRKNVEALKEGHRKLEA